MAVIINFQKYANSRKKRNGKVKVNNNSTEGGKIIYFNREDAGL